LAVQSASAVEDITPAGIVDPLGISSKIKNDLFDRSGRAKENSLGLLTQVPLIGIGALGLERFSRIILP